MLRKKKEEEGKGETWKKQNSCVSDHFWRVNAVASSSANVLHLQLGWVLLLLYNKWPSGPVASKGLSVGESTALGCVCQKLNGNKHRCIGSCTVLCPCLRVFLPPAWGACTVFSSRCSKEQQD